MPVSNISTLVRLLGELREARGESATRFPQHRWRARSSTGSPMTLMMRPSTFADGHGDGLAGVLHGHAAGEAVGGVHRDAADDILTKVLGDLEGEVVRLLVVDEGVGRR